MTFHNPAECLTCRTGRCNKCPAVFTRGGFSDSATCPTCLKVERDLTGEVELPAMTTNTRGRGGA